MEFKELIIFVRLNAKPKTSTSVVYFLKAQPIYILGPIYELKKKRLDAMLSM
jgi:hypothetical protein